MKLRRLFLSFVLVSLTASAHVREVSSTGAGLVVTNPENVLFLTNEDLKPGLRNAAGRVVIAADSDPAGAIQAAADTWSNAGSRLRIALSTTQLAGNPIDRTNVILLKDTAEVRSIVGSALAVTDTRFLVATGSIVDSDIYLNPNVSVPFGTTGGQNMYDLQSILTHEIGHAIGADHSPLPSATMFWNISNLYARTLSDDDLSFVRTVYPPLGAPSATGTIAGFVTLPSALPGRSVMVTALDPATGVTLSSLSSAVNGAFFLNGVLPGKYLVYAEPLDGPALPQNFFITLADTNFETTFHGSSSTLVEVVAGGAVNADIALSPKVGTLAIDSVFALARGAQNGLGDLFENQAAIELHPGESLDLLFGGPGFDLSITESNIQLLGPGIKIRPGSLVVEPVLSFFDGSRIMRMTVDVEDVPRRSVVSLMVRKGNGFVTRSAAYVIQPLPPLTLLSSGVINAAALTGGNLAPNSWVSIFSEKLALTLVPGIAPLPNILGGTRVEVVDSRGRNRVASLQFVSPGQVNFLMPSGVATGTGEVQVYGLLGKGTAKVNIQPVAAGIFSASANGRGPAAAAYLSVAPNGTRTSGFTFDAGTAARPNVPISLGPTGTEVYLTFYGTGLRTHAEPVTAVIGGFPTLVLAAVAQGQFAGLDQINVGPLPRDLIGRGDVDVIFNVDGQPTNPVTVKIQ